MFVISDAFEAISPVTNPVTSSVSHQVSLPVSNTVSTPIRNPVSNPVSTPIHTSLRSTVSNTVSPIENSAVSNSVSTLVSEPPTNHIDTSVSTPVKIKPLPEQENEDVVYGTILSLSAPGSYQTEQDNLAAVGDHFVKVFWSVQVINNGVGAAAKDSLSHDLSDMEKASTLNSENPIDVNVVKNYCNLKNLAAELNGSLKEPLSDTRLQSSSSEGSLCKYLTPIGSVSDLTSQPGDKSPLPPGVKTGPNEDSGVDSQSLSISQSANNTVSSNGDLENTFLSSDLIPEDSVNTESSALKGMLFVLFISQNFSHQLPHNIRIAKIARH